MAGHRMLRRAIVSLGTLGAVTSAVLLGSAGTAGGWSAEATSALPGAAVHVYSAPGEVCVWDVTSPDGSTATRYAGTRVEIAMGGRSMGSASVAPIGAWSGVVYVPTLDPGVYPLTARCIVEHPDLPETHAFDFPARTFEVAATTPPTTATTAPPPPPPLIGTSVTTVPARRTNRPSTAPRAPATRDPRPTLPNTGPGPSTLPNTGDGTLGVALAGLGSLALGAGALWWGGRRRAATEDGGPPISR